MKCLLILLALGLVTSDKLDRTYLPPPGAKYSGGTLDDLHLPLVFPKESITGTIVNGPVVGNYPDKSLIGDSTKLVFENGLSTFPINYATSKLPDDLNQSPEDPVTTNEYQSTFATSKPILSFYDSFPPKSPSSGYLPSKQSNVGTQSYPVFNPNPELKKVATTNNFTPGVDQKNTGYYYYAPAIQTYNNDVGSQRLSDGSSTLGLVQLPNQVQNGYLLGHGQTYMPTTKTSNYVFDNYQPGTFGYYGGNPMIMSSQNSLPEEFGGMKLISFGGNENNIPASINQDKIKNKKKTPIRPFQTPLVRLNSKNALKPANSKITTTAANTLPSLFPTATTRSFSKENVPAALDKMNGLPIRTRFRQERPQAESERTAVIINYENSIYPDGYSYGYDTSNGIHADESGIATNGVRAKGSYSYTGDDGKIYTLSYTADENGFQPRGDHLPTAPPIPEAIQKVVDQVTRDKTTGIIDDGSYDEKKYGHMNYQGAMDRYNLFKKKNNKVLGLNGQTKESGLLKNKNKNEFYNMPLYNNNEANTNKKTNDTLSSLQNLRNQDINQINPQKNELSGRNTLDTGSRSKFKEHNQNKESLNKQNGTTITSVTDNQITNRGTENGNFEIQNPYVNGKPINNKVAMSNTNTPDQVSQKIIPSTSSRVTFTDDGYYYVPPIVQFNPKNEKLNIEKKLYLTTNKPTPKAIESEANKRIGFDGSQKRKDDYENGNSTQSPLKLRTIAREQTRQPYLSGPVDQDKPNYYNDLLNVPAESARNDPATYRNDLDSSSLGLNTTPMTAQTIQESQPLDKYSQYYQSTKSPTVFDQTLPSAVENRVNIPSRNPGITVSQDFVTTTYRPFISGDGVLEVNQNVKIYGIGRPETSTVNNGYIYNVPDDNNNGLYSTTIPDGDSNILGVYPNNFKIGPMQDATLFHGISNENIPYGNEYLTTGIPGTDSDGPYSNVSFDGQSQGYVPFLNTNVFGNPELIPGQELPIPNISMKIQDLDGRIIGEDFSGPKQPQKFDPETGYYY